MRATSTSRMRSRIHVRFNVGSPLMTLRMTVFMACLATTTPDDLVVPVSSRPLVLARVPPRHLSFALALRERNAVPVMRRSVYWLPLSSPLPQQRSVYLHGMPIFGLTQQLLHRR